MHNKELRKIRRKYLDRHLPYKMEWYENFNYKILSNIMYLKKAGRGGNETYNDVIIMADTESSKKKPALEAIAKLPAEPTDEERAACIRENHICAWTISLRAYDRNLVTLWGRGPEQMIDCIAMLLDHMPGELTFCYIQNLSWDWTYLRRFFFQKFGTPIKQLNTKPHYPIFIKFASGLILRDTLILSQRRLEKWANDLQVEHRKAVGKWDYDKYRTQSQEKDPLSPDELEYIECDTLAGVECIDKTMKALHKKIYSMPYTATGIPREEIRERGKANDAHEWFISVVPDYEQYLTLEQTYHGGYTHGNRHHLGQTICGIYNGWLEFLIKCKDFSSSYPFSILSERFPSERFFDFENCKKDYILSQAEEYAYFFKFTMYDFKLKDDSIEMPYLQSSKCVKKMNFVEDNGRVLAGLVASIYITEQDLIILNEQYDMRGNMCTEVRASRKDYLPRWITDYVYELYKAKCELKHSDDPENYDPVAYSIAKSRLNSIYGLFCQKCVRENILEDYETGDYTPEEDLDFEKEYSKYVNRLNSMLPYFVGVWTTAYSTRHLFQLAECIDREHGGRWLYTDTDSIYSDGWDEDKVAAYNENCKRMLLKNGYRGVTIGKREFWPGVAEDDSVYTEFRYTGAKRYCGRSFKDGKLKITIAGVPKSGAKCLNDRIENMHKGFKFKGEVTGKKTHTYFYNEIYVDEDGNQTGDSIDLSPCDYKLDTVNLLDWERIYDEEIKVQVYEEE